MYDAMQSEQASQDNARAALHAAMTKETAKDLGAIPRWVPHDKNPADALTKCDGAHCTPLIELATKGRWRLTFEEDELATRAEYREKTGKSNPRPRHSKVQKPRRRADDEGYDEHVCWIKVHPSNYAQVMDTAEPLPEVQEFPIPPVTATATEAFNVWKEQSQMPDLELVSGSDTDDSLDAFVAQEMPRVSRATL